MVKTIKKIEVNTVEEINDTLKKYLIPVSDNEKENKINFFMIKFIERNELTPCNNMIENKIMADLIWKRITEEDIQHRKNEEQRILDNNLLYAKYLEDNYKQIKENKNKLYSI
jgi:hypothetical protein